MTPIQRLHTAQKLAEADGIDLATASRRLDENLAQKRAAMVGIDPFTFSRALLARKDLSARIKLVGQAILSFQNPQHCYVWPSVQSLSAAIGGLDKSHLIRSITKLQELEILKRIRIPDLPVELKEAALKGSKRGIRGTAYRLHEPDFWMPENGQMATYIGGETATLNKQV